MAVKTPIENYNKFEILVAEHGYVLTFIPPNKDLEKMVTNYVKEFMQKLQGLDGEEWKQTLEKKVDEALNMNNENRIMVFTNWKELSKELNKIHYQITDKH